MMEISELKDSIERSNWEFPIAVYRDEFFTNRTSVPHYHNEIEIVIALKGDIVVSCNNQDIIVRQGESLIINSDVVHIVKHADYPSSQILCIVFNPVLLYGYKNSSIEEKYVNPIVRSSISYISIPSTGWGEKCFTAYNEVAKHYFAKKNGYEIAVKIMLLDAWLILIRNLSLHLENNITNPNSKTKIVKLAMAFINKNYSSDIDLKDIAHEVGLSSSELCKLFKRHLSESPMQIVLKKRIAAACYYLTYTDEALSSISLKIGFSDANYVAIAFKKHLGMTPSSYRKRSREDIKN